MEECLFIFISEAGTSIQHSKFYGTCTYPLTLEPMAYFIIQHITYFLLNCSTILSKHVKPTNNNLKLIVIQTRLFPTDAN